MIIPLKKKCYQTSKLEFLLFLLFILFKRGSYAYVPGFKEFEYEAQILKDKARIAPGLGEGGEAVELASPEKEIMGESVKKNVTNVYRKPYNRTLKADLMKLEDQREKLHKIMLSNTHTAPSQMSVEDPWLEYGTSVEVTTPPRHENDTQPPEDNQTRRLSKRRRAHKRHHNYKKHGKNRFGLPYESKRTKKVKNKFMLKLIRSIDNKTEEHVEVDIHCRHAPLYPNNTFVRDLVRLMNDNHIKVVNNGRVLDKTRVMDLNIKAVLNKLAVSDVTLVDDITSTPQKFAEAMTDWMDVTTVRHEITSSRPRLFLPPRLLRPPRLPLAEDVVSVLRRITNRKGIMKNGLLNLQNFGLNTKWQTEQTTEEATESLRIMSQMSTPRDEVLQLMSQSWTDEHPEERVQMFEDERAESRGSLKDLLSVIADSASRHAFNGSNTRRLDPDPNTFNDGDPMKVVMSNNITISLADKLFGRTTVGLEELTSSPPPLPPRLAPVELPPSTPRPITEGRYMRVIDSYSSEASSESRSYD